MNFILCLVFESICISYSYGAGLGGGSSDAAYTLKLLNTMFDLKLSNDELKAFALILGSDCPLFIDNNLNMEKVELSFKPGEY